MDIELKKALSDDTEVNMINKMFISLKNNEIKRNNYYLSIINYIIAKMKEKDTLFARSYKKITFCGSFYKNTKVEKPNEFDLNIVLSLPIHPNKINLYSTQPGYVKIEITDLSFYTSSPKYNVTNTYEMKILRKLISNGHLNPHEFRSWVESILNKIGSEITVMTESDTINLVKIKKSGPAFTLILNISSQTEYINVDFVPALSFNNCEIIGSTINFYELQKYDNKEWFAIAVAKDIDGNNKDYQWRCSFFYQEKKILARHGRIKVVIRLMKKLRDTQNWHCIASYFIETLFLNNLEELQWTLNSISITQFFYLMLKKMHCAFQKQRIEYFWDKNYNLLGRIGKAEMTNITYKLQKIINNIEKCVNTDIFKIAQFVLNAQEFELFQLEYNRKENINQTINSKL